MQTPRVSVRNPSPTLQLRPQVRPQLRSASHGFQFEGELPMVARAQVKPDFDGPEDRQLADDIARAMHHRPLMSRLKRVEAMHGNAAGAVAKSATRLAPVSSAPVAAETPPPALPIDPRSLDEVIDDLGPCGDAAAQRRVARQGAARASQGTPAQRLGVGDDAGHRRHHRRRGLSAAARLNALGQESFIEIERLARRLAALGVAMRRHPGKVRSRLGRSARAQLDADRIAGLGGERLQQREVELLPVGARRIRRRRQRDARRQFRAPPRGKAVDGRCRLQLPARFALAAGACIGAEIDRVPLLGVEQLLAPQACARRCCSGSSSWRWRDRTPCRPRRRTRRGCDRM